MEPANKKQRRVQTFLPEYSLRWPLLTISKLGNTYAMCTVCNTDFSVAHGGANDCAKHVRGLRHKKHTDSSAQHMKIRKLFHPKEQEDVQQVINGDLFMTAFFVEHNIAYKNN